MYLKISKQIPQATHHPSHYRHSIRNSKVDKEKAIVKKEVPNSNHLQMLLWIKNVIRLTLNE
ncbi:hypothetical protein DERF_006138 [Dermatophagoides farinae]|uniref:Uncharacterized protein n=1 Tax=Dermatophagoides farinae TaxID=6954 RepID=A0A922I5K5_DERFA|nr:hypothetical protein DERF_006138 [Dermatophagoides farinae]